MVKNLKYLREKKGLSQAALAAVLGITQQSVNKYENQTTEPDIAMLMNMANFFNTSVDFLVGNTSIEHKYEIIYKSDLNESELNFVEEYRSTGESDRKVIMQMFKALNKKK